MYDFVVVGVGPAGARFARRAAEAGYDVLALEQGRLGEPLACSGHVSRDVWAYAGEDARDELLQNEVYGARFHVDGPGSGFEDFHKPEVVSNVIDRVGLDRHLAGLAREAGVDVREEHTVTAVEECTASVTMTVRGPDGVEAVETKMVAGCDGPTSRVRRDLDLPEPDELLHGVLGFSDDADHGDRVDVHLTMPEFFAWRIPRGDAGVEYGLAASPGPNVNELFDDLVGPDGYDAEVSKRCSGLIPVGPADSVTSHRGFLIGDAAAQTKPFTGGGILYGMRSADHAAREIEPDRPGTLGAYEAAWRDELATEIRLGHWIRCAYSLPEPVQRAGLKAFSGEIGVHMDRPTSVFSREHLASWLGRSRR